MEPLSCTFWHFLQLNNSVCQTRTDAEERIESIRSIIPRIVFLRPFSLPDLLSYSQSDLERADKLYPLNHSRRDSTETLDSSRDQPNLSRLIAHLLLDDKVFAFHCALWPSSSSVQETLEVLAYHGAFQRRVRILRLSNEQQTEALTFPSGVSVTDIQITDQSPSVVANKGIYHGEQAIQQLGHFREQMIDIWVQPRIVCAESISPSCNDIVVVVDNRKTPALHVRSVASCTETEIGRSHHPTLQLCNRDPTVLLEAWAALYERMPSALQRACPTTSNETSLVVDPQAKDAGMDVAAIDAVCSERLLILPTDLQSRGVPQWAAIGHAKMVRAWLTSGLDKVEQKRKQAVLPTTSSVDTIMVPLYFPGRPSPYPVFVQIPMVKEAICLRMDKLWGIRGSLHNLPDQLILKSFHRRSFVLRHIQTGYYLGRNVPHHMLERQRQQPQQQVKPNANTTVSKTKPAPKTIRMVVKREHAMTFTMQISPPNPFVVFTCSHSGDRLYVETEQAGCEQYRWPRPVIRIGQPAQASNQQFRIGFASDPTTGQLQQLQTTKDAPTFLFRWFHGQTDTGVGTLGGYQMVQCDVPPVNQGANTWEFVWTSIPTKTSAFTFEIR